MMAHHLAHRFKWSNPPPPNVPTTNSKCVQDKFVLTTAQKKSVLRSQQFDWSRYQIDIEDQNSFDHYVLVSTNNGHLLLLLSIEKDPQQVHKRTKWTGEPYPHSTERILSRKETSAWSMHLVIGRKSSRNIHFNVVLFISEGRRRNKGRTLDQMRRKGKAAHGPLLGRKESHDNHCQRAVVHR